MQKEFNSNEFGVGLFGAEVRCVARKEFIKLMNNGNLCIAKTTLLPYKKHSNVLDVDFGNGVLVMLIVPEGLPMVCANDLLKLDGLGEVKNHKLMATNYQILGGVIL